MLKVVSVVDQMGSDTQRLATGLSPYMDRFDYQVIDVHPKSPSLSQLKVFENLGKYAHIIDFQHAETSFMLLKRYPWVKDKKKILVNYDPHPLGKSDYQQFEKVVTSNKTMNKRIPNSVYIPQTIDTNFWTFNNQWKINKNVIMVVDRIAKEKGILEVAVACRNLGLNLFLIGSSSDKSYFDQVMKTGCVILQQRTDNEKLRQLYYESSLYVCNSVDNFESGPLSVIEAMLCGVPVLSRPVGHVPDLYNRENIQLLACASEDINMITNTIGDLIFKKKTLGQMREKAWQMASKFADERRAYSYQRLYRSLFDGTPVSVIVSIYEYPKTLLSCLQAIANQDYPNLELIVCDDNPSGDNEALVKKYASSVPLPVVYRNTSRQENDYGLARARNVGIIEASGDILVFCDQRITMHPDAVSEFVRNLAPRKWLYGTKGVIKGFVENFSCVYRNELIRAGMFCERVDHYGGMTQEIFGRTKAQGFKHELVPSVKASFNIESNSLARRRAEIISMRNRLFRMNL